MHSDFTLNKIDRKKKPQKIFKGIYRFQPIDEVRSILELAILSVSYFILTYAQKNVCARMCVCVCVWHLIHASLSAIQMGLSLTIR